MTTSAVGAGFPIPPEQSPVVYSSHAQAEVGLIPEDWLSPQLQQITEDESPICYGIVQPGPFTPNGIPVLAIKDLTFPSMDSIHSASIEIERVYARSRVRSNDVLVSVKGTTGRVGLVPGHFQGNISRDLARIRPRAGVDPRFIYQVLQSEVVQRRLATATVGTTRMELSIAILKQVRIPLPPTRTEQEAIAGALSDVDGLLLTLEALIAKKRAIKQAAMQQLLTGKTRLPGFSGEWKVKTLGELTNEEIRDGSTPSTADPRNFGGGIGWVVIDDIRDEIHATATTLTERGLRSCAATLWKPGTLILSTGATIGEVGIARIPVATKQGICGIVFDPAEATPFFMKYWFMQNRSKLLGKAQGSTIKEVRAPTLVKLELAVPDIPEQAAIASALSDMDAEIVALEAQRDKTRAIKQGMMQRLLTGRVRLVEPPPVEAGV